jgi:hypothetical protein
MKDVTETEVATYLECNLKIHSVPKLAKALDALATQLETILARLHAAGKIMRTGTVARPSFCSRQVIKKYSDMRRNKCGRKAGEISSTSDIPVLQELSYAGFLATQKESPKEAPPKVIKPFKPYAGFPKAVTDKLRDYHYFSVGDRVASGEGDA